MNQDAVQVTLRALSNCFEGAVPAIIATASADGIPNVTYLSRVRLVDDERVALSNQFFSKTSRNLTENPRASLIVVDPRSFDQFRLALVYERTDRRGPVFEHLREDVDTVAALQGMQDVFKLRAADIYRVLQIDAVTAARHHQPATVSPQVSARADTAAPHGLIDLGSRLSRCSDLDTLVDTTVSGLAELLGYEHAVLLLLDEEERRLYTIASHGYDAQGVGSEVAVGDGIVGMAAARCTPLSVGNIGQVAKYSAAIRRSFEDHGEVGPGREIAVPGMVYAQSQIAVPAMALGELVGVLTVQSTEPVAFGESDLAVLSTVATLVANAIEVVRGRERAEEGGDGASTPRREPASTAAPPAHIRFFAADGSTFIDGDYLIKGVAGRILWALLGHYDREGRVEFTNREVRLEPALELPAYRDNLESRLIMLKRRLDERSAPIRIHKAGRGRFRLEVDKALRLETTEVP